MKVLLIVVGWTIGLLVGGVYSAINFIAYQMPVFQLIKILVTTGALSGGIGGLFVGLSDGLDAPVFCSRKGKGHLDPSQVHRIVAAAAQRAGIKEKISPHWLRHAHASHSLDRGAPIHLLQSTLGHASIATTGKYLHARPADSSALYLGL